VHTADFEYALPEESIAQSAVEPRDSSRLLVTSDVSDHRFSDLPELLLPGDLLVVNRTRVRAARLVGKRVGSEGIVEALSGGRPRPSAAAPIHRDGIAVHYDARFDLGA